MGDITSSYTEHLLITVPFPEPVAVINGMRSRFPYIKFTYVQTTSLVDSSEIDPSLYKTTTILATHFVLPKSIDECPNLKYIHFSSAGTNHVADNPYFKSTNIPITQSSGIHGPPIAEWWTLTALNFAHAYDELHELQRQNQWNDLVTNAAVFMPKTYDMVGQRIGILGYGSIGRQVGRLARALGMTVLAYTASARTTAEQRRDDGFIIEGTGDPDGSIPAAWYSGTSKASIHEFLSQRLDHLFVSVPLIPSTFHLIGKEELSILAKCSSGAQTKTGGCFLSNVSRGQIIDQEALVDSLRRGPAAGGLRGAALDVADPEPLPKDNALWTAPNVVITPHISALTIEYYTRAFQVLEENLTRLEHGGRLLNLIDKSKGYKVNFSGE